MLDHVTVLRIYNHLSKVIPAFFNNKDIVCMGADEVADRYDRILEYFAIQYIESLECDDTEKDLILSNSKIFKQDSQENIYKDDYIDGVFKTQSLVSKELKDFHQFMVVEYEVEKIIFESLDGFMSLRHSVNANIIMPNEYMEILHSLWPSRNDSDRQGYINYLIFVIGFRLGLRRMEILQLRLRDVLGRKFIILRVLKNEYGEVKSSSAKRQLLLYDLLNEAECADFERWVNIRKNEVGGNIDKSLLFTFSPAEVECKSGLDKLLTISLTYDVIHKVMRVVAGDDEITFHCTRHSFLSWHILFQEAERIPSIIDEGIYAFKNIDKTIVFPRNFKTLLNYEENSSKILYQLCVLAGHSTPNMTLLHYCHLLDWISYNWMLRSIPSFNEKEISILLGLKKSSIYTKLKNINTNTNKNGEYNIQDCIHLSKKSLLNSI